MAGAKIDVALKGGSPHFVEGNSLCVVTGWGCDDQSPLHDLGIRHCPLQNLHSTHASSDDGVEAIDTQVFYQASLGRDHIGNGQFRKGDAVGFPRGGV